MDLYYTTTVPSPVGSLTLASDGTALTGLWLEGQAYFGGRCPESLQPGGENLPIFQQTRSWLARYFSGERPVPSELPLSPKGTPFQQAVWSLLCEIPYGTVTTYGALATALAQRLHRSASAPRAVGGAVGHNPISIVIPCHRVVGAAGSLTGYAGGLQRKLWLLQREGIDTSCFTVPKSKGAPQN